MNIRPCRSELDLHSLAGTARAIIRSTRTVAEVHITDLKGQLDDLWKAAEDLILVSRRQARCAPIFHSGRAWEMKL